MTTYTNPLRYDLNEFHFDAASEGGEGLDGFHASGEWIDGEARIDQFWPLPDAEDVRVYRWGANWQSQQSRILESLERHLTACRDNYYSNRRD